MGSGMPEIGSRISLISKADIRYEGKLYSVDPEECTIALSSVRSYGTEDRKTTYPVPAQNQVYDYILFRGSDIKDIRVLTTTIPNDPAIVQLSVPPTINELQFQSQSGYPPPSMSSMTIPSVVAGPSRGQPSTGEFQNTAGFVTSASGTNITHAIPKPQAVPNISEDESRSSTPSTQNAIQHNKNSVESNRQQNNVVSKSDEQTQQRRPAAYQQRDNRPNQQNRYQQHQKPQYQQQQRYPQHQQQQQNLRYPQQNQRYPQQQRYMHPQYRDYRDSSNQYRSQNDYRDQYAARQYPKWNNQRPGPQNNQQQQNYQSTAYQNRKPRNTLKFENDFDFEQANSEFEEVKSKLASVKIDDGVKLNGDVEAKKEDSGNEVSGEENDPENDDKPIFYDKVKSFFDQISYEAIERSKGHTQRLDWKTERKINSETFGPVALRRNNNFRGPRPGGNYYNNYQSNNYQGNNYQNRNPAMANKFRGGYRQKTPQTRRPYNEVKINDDSKGNQSA